MILEAGGTAIGVEPKFFMDAELQYDGLTELIKQMIWPAEKQR